MWFYLKLYILQADDDFLKFILCLKLFSEIHFCMWIAFTFFVALIRLLMYHKASVNSGCASHCNHQDSGTSICITVIKLASHYFSKEIHFASVVAVIKFGHKGIYTRDPRKAACRAKANELQNLNQYLLENVCAGHSALLLRPLQKSSLLDLTLQVFLKFSFSEINLKHFFDADIGFALPFAILIRLLLLLMAAERIPLFRYLQHQIPHRRHQQPPNWANTASAFDFTSASTHARTWLRLRVHLATSIHAACRTWNKLILRYHHPQSINLGLVLVFKTLSIFSIWNGIHWHYSLQILKTLYSQKCARNDN